MQRYGACEELETKREQKPKPSKVEVKLEEVPTDNSNRIKSNLVVKKRKFEDFVEETKLEAEPKLVIVSPPPAEPKAKLQRVRE